MFRNSKEITISKALESWQDPQGNPLLILSEQSCDVFLGCWTETGEPANYICKISFSSAWASRSYTNEFLPYEIKDSGRSSILEITNSKWLKESVEYRLKTYPHWKPSNKEMYHHFVIQGHDLYVEVLAESYIEQIIPLNEFDKLLPPKYLNYFNQ